MTLSGHLNELRQRVVRSAVAIVLVFAASWIFIEPLMNVLLAPHYAAMRELKSSQPAAASLKLLDEIPTQEMDEGVAKSLQTIRQYLEAKEFDNRPIVTGYVETVATYLKACFVISLLVAGPYVLWQIWGFIAAGLYVNEKKFIHRYFIFGFLLFLSGVAFGYFFLIPVSLSFLASFGSDIVRPEFRIGEYFSLFLTLTLALGLVFQVPIVMVVLSRLGIIEPQVYRGKWRIVLVGCFVLSAIVTPTPDPLTQTLVALPTYLLYELGVLCSKFAYRERQKNMEEAAT